MNNNETKWDKLLRIKISGRDDSRADEYISYLMTVDELAFMDEIDCRELFDGENPRERIVIFEVMV